MMFDYCSKCLQNSLHRFYIASRTSGLHLKDSLISVKNPVACKFSRQYPVSKKTFFSKSPYLPGKVTFLSISLYINIFFQILVHLKNTSYILTEYKNIKK